MAKTSHSIEEFWNQYLLSLPEAERNQSYLEASTWGNSAELADRIARLIAEGIKTTTSSLLWAQEKEKWPIEQAGDKSIVLDSKEMPVCIIESIQTVIKPFNEVDEQFVYNYGEGDRTMNFWFQSMWDYYQEECKRIDKKAEKDMPMICHEFKLIYKA